MKIINKKLRGYSSEVANSNEWLNPEWTYNKTLPGKLSSEEEN